MAFDSIVFAGGGSRCFWQLGFCHELREHTDLRPKQLAAVSAGAAMACLVVAGRAPRAVDHFAGATFRNRRNFYPTRWLQGRPAFPHLGMYRAAILDSLDDAAFARLLAGPEIRVLLARMPGWLGRRSGAVVAGAVYGAERRLVNRVHPRWCRNLGYRPEVVRAQDCASAHEVADLILHSSCTPPLTPLFFRGGSPVIDGGAIDPVPTLVLQDSPGRTLVLLTAPFPGRRIPARTDVVYVQPSRRIPVAKWDYTNPRGIRRAFELGRADARAFARREL